jgi:hypothetical protein
MFFQNNFTNKKTSELLNISEETINNINNILGINNPDHSNIIKFTEYLNEFFYNLTFNLNDDEIKSMVTFILILPNELRPIVLKTELTSELRSLLDINVINVHYYNNMSRIIFLLPIKRPINKIPWNLLKDTQQLLLLHISINYISQIKCPSIKTTTFCFKEND